MGRWSPRLDTSPERALSGTWLVLVGGFIALGFVWASLAYRFQVAAAPRAMLAALFVAGVHVLAGLANVRRGSLAFLASLAAVALGVIVAILVRVYFLVGVDVVAGILLVLGRAALLSGPERR
ncbi:hypothetical protein OO015_11145 [Thermomicrobium sp. 4228-Ro]|uniref:hypothetical protein n=1 Tax=Thermomicrobium sp. 4228-Ro TaxID=2993937 RepID=UPI0022492BEB|nr:hypothetical protein [Thermomicrobium sp. 4228-Ro]MCX2728046.1 hypothetical protein [Thermomicrobium sp. 4228-Ro]